VNDQGKGEASKEENKQSSQNDIQNGCFTSVPSLLLLVCLFLIHDSPTAIRMYTKTMHSHL
jgi:hypothetical protein